jgi:Na+/pantothenate symporter
MLEPTRRQSSHPVIKAGVAVGAVVLVALVAMSLVSVVVGFAWDVVKIALLVAVVAGIWHMVHNSHQASSSRER